MEGLTALSLLAFSRFWRFFPVSRPEACPVHPVVRSSVRSIPGFRHCSRPLIFCICILHQIFWIFSPHSVSTSCVLVMCSSQLLRLSTHICSSHSPVLVFLFVFFFRVSRSSVIYKILPSIACISFPFSFLCVVLRHIFYYDESSPIFLLTDASDYGIGGYLYQLINGIEHPVAFISKSLSGSQLRWTTIQKEAYAIFIASRN